jgi:hypothetical protein
MCDRLCGLVLRVLGYRSGGPGSIPGTTRKEKVVGLERGQLILVSTTEELLGRKSRGSCLENREYGSRDPSRWPRDTLYQQKLAITSPTSGGRSVGIVRSRTRTIEVFFSKRCALPVPAARQNFSRRVTKGFRGKLPSVKSRSNQPALCTHSTWTHKSISRA